MIVNGKSLIQYAPIKDMLGTKEKLHGVSHGLSEAGYDIRIKQEIKFYPGTNGRISTMYPDDPEFVMHKEEFFGRFCLASAIEEFQMPSNLVGVVHDKSTWARHGLQVFNTVIEPGWKGFLTLELAYWGHEELIIPAGSGIAQVLFHGLVSHSNYSGKYDNQPDEPVNPIMS